MNSNLKRAARQLTNQFEDYQEVYAATMGVTDTGVVSVPNKTNYVYVRMRPTEISEVWNDKVRVDKPGLKVWVGYEKTKPGLLQVLGVRNVESRPTWNGVLNHSDTHQWPNDDTLYVRQEQFLPGLIAPVTGNDMQVRVYGGAYLGTGSWYQVPYSDYDLSSYVPVTGAYWLEVSEAGTGSIRFRAGTWRSNKSAIRMTDFPAPDHQGQPLGFILMYAGKSKIEKTEKVSDIWDARWSNYAQAANARWIQGIPVASTTPTEDYILRYKNGAWRPTKDEGGGAGTMLPYDLTNLNSGTSNAFPLPSPATGSMTSLYINGVRQNFLAGHFAVTGSYLYTDRVFPTGTTIYVDYPTQTEDILILPDAPDANPYIRSSLGWGQLKTDVLTYFPTGTYTTTSASYVNIDSASIKLAFTKNYSGTNIVVDLDVSLYATATNTVSSLGIYDGSTTHDVVKAAFNPANTHLPFSASKKITGLTPGNYTFYVRWKRISGTGVLTIDTSDTVSLKITEAP